VVIALALHPTTLTHAEQLEPKAHKLVTVTTSQPVQKPKVETAAVVEPNAPVAPPPVTPTYPSSCSAYEPIVAQYNWNVRVAMAIMQAESGCNPYAISPASLNYDGVSDYGLFQIHGQYILNPSDNIAAAYQKYLSQGWNAWSTYSSGTVWRYY